MKATSSLWLLMPQSRSNDRSVYVAITSSVAAEMIFSSATTAITAVGKLLHPNGSRQHRKLNRIDFPPPRSLCYYHYC